MRTLWLAPILLASTNALARSAGDERPSVLLIVADDLSQESLGLYGNPVPALTPRIDRLAAESTTFHDVHVNVAVCQPCRAVLLTGRWPHRNGARGFEPIAPGVRTLPARLRAAGYRNGILGKTEHCEPEAAFAWDRVVPRSALREGRSPRRYAEEVQRFLAETAPDVPFFLMVNAHDPHRPFPGSQAEARQRERARDYPEVDAPLDPSAIRVPGFLPDLPDVRAELAQYYAAVRRFDALVDAVLRALEDAGRADDTLVIVTSDHGMPFPFAKTNCYEASTRVPFVVRWPGRVPAGRVDREHVLATIDFAPTVLEAAGIARDDELDGRSFLPVLRGERQEGRERAFTSFYETSARREYPMRGVIERDAVYVWNPWSDGELRFRNESQAGLTFAAMQRAARTDETIAARVRHFLFRTVEELYDRRSDPDALRNLAETDRARRDRLRSTLLEHLRATQDPLLADYETFLGARLPLAPVSDADWLAVGNDRGAMRYSPLDQIRKDNVHALEVAWTFHTGELEGRAGKIIECTPLVVDGVMYVTTAYLRVCALDATTGRLRWSFDPFGTVDGVRLEPAGPLASGGVNRGCAYWSDGEPDGERRILHGTSDGRLIALDARTGALVPSFGTGGIVDLHAGLEPDVRHLPYGPTSAPAICRDVVVLGFSCGEGPERAAPGDVRAFDVRSGAERWRFHTVPRTGEPGNDTWEGDSWQGRGGANAWGGVSVDERRNLVFFGLGSAAFDFYGGDRRGQNLFANSTLALDAATGRPIWHFQTLHHDLWDHDLPVYPNLIPVRRDGVLVDAVAQVTKTGYVYLFDRTSGEPLFEIVERPVPPSDVPGEQAWPTQPIPVRPPPFCRTTFFAEDATDVDDAARADVLQRLEHLRHGPAFLPPSLEGTVTVPGFHGGATWSGASYDPERQTLYVNANDVPNLARLVPAEAGSRFPYRYARYERFLDREGRPAIRPPWGTLNAIDLVHGTIRWKVPLGRDEELEARGVPQTGTENFGGTIVTKGGLVFVGATKDERFHAFDADTGALLFETKLPAGGYATPCTYAVGGRQYVTIAAGGAGKLGTPAGDAFVTFALPR